MQSKAVGEMKLMIGIECRFITKKDLVDHKEDPS